MADLSIKKPDAILFDWDATLADTYDLMEAAYNKALAEFGYDKRPYGWLRPFFGKTKEYTYPEIYTRHTSDDYAAIDAVFISHIKEHHISQVKPMADAVPVLNLIKDLGIKCGIVTNKRPYLAHPEIENFGWGHHFETIICYGDASDNKPSAEPLLLAAKNLGLDASTDNIWLVGDSSSDQGCAKNSTCGFIHYDDGDMPPLNYEVYSPVFSVKSYKDFYRVLEKNFK